MARTKEEEYQDRNKRLIEMGIKPVYNSLKEEKKAKEERDLMLKKFGGKNKNGNKM